MVAKSGKPKEETTPVVEEVEGAPADEVNTDEIAEPANCECACVCDCEYPYFANYNVVWRDMDVDRIVTVLGQTDTGKAIVFHESLGVKSLDFASLERL